MEGCSLGKNGWMEKGPFRVGMATNKIRGRSGVAFVLFVDPNFQENGEKGPPHKCVMF